MAKVRHRSILTGDNLEILRVFDSECVDLVYLDPPFNSGRDHEDFDDTWDGSDLNASWMALVENQCSVAFDVLQVAGLAHSTGMQSYLCMLAVRLFELHRVLKPTGSIYLHCDNAASHYLKMLMDAIFGRVNFQNAIIWHRTAENLSRKKYRRAYEVLMQYSKSSDPTWNLQYTELDAKQVKRDYRFEDDHGSYTTTSCTNNAKRPNMVYEFHGNMRQWRYSHETMLQLERGGLLVFNKNGMPRRKRYLSDAPGRTLTNVWSDVNVLASNAGERTGYATQKPLALLERIIKASSNLGDVVLDPFCGSGTACVAAKRLDRQWIGIDMSKEATTLTARRLSEMDSRQCAQMDMYLDG